MPLHSTLTSKLSPSHAWSWEQKIRNIDKWEGFHECIRKTDGTAHVRCKHCKKTFLHPGRNAQRTSTSMGRHLKECQRYLQTLDGVESSVSIDTLFQQATTLADEVLTDDIVQDKILNFFISGNIAFNQADNPEFQALIALIKVNGRRVVINRKKIRNRLDHHAEAAKEDLMTHLIENESKISLALDCWTSAANHAYLGITPSVAYKIPLSLLICSICMLHL